MRLLHARHADLGARRCSRENPDPSEDEVRVALSGNLCRCTGYQRIAKAVLSAAPGANEPAHPLPREPIEHMPLAA